LPLPARFQGFDDLGRTDRLLDVSDRVGEHRHRILAATRHDQAGQVRRGEPFYEVECHPATQVEVEDSRVHSRRDHQLFGLLHGIRGPDRLGSDLAQGSRQIVG